MNRWTVMTALALGFVVSSVWACPGHDAKTGCQKAALVVKADAKTADDAKNAGSEKNCEHPCPMAARLVSDKDGEHKGGCSKPCHEGAKTAAAHEGGSKKCHKGCPEIAKEVAAIMTDMPSMKYRVGEETTCCDKSAAQMVEKTGKTLQYVVADKTYQKKDEAVAALTSLLEDHAKTMASVQFSVDGKCSRCPVTAKSIAKQKGSKVMYRVAGVDFGCKTEATKVAKLVSEAAEEVGMTYVVKGKEYGCPKTAASKCTKGQKVMYKVADTETGCEIEARHLLAEAKIRTMIETAVMAQHEQGEKTAKGETTGHQDDKA